MSNVEDIPPLERLNREFNEAVREIMYLAIRIDNPYERVKVMYWVRKLREQDDSNLRCSRIRNEYVQYMRIMLSSETINFCFPFKKKPPEDLAPLSEVLGNRITEKLPNVPKTGPIQPVMCHKTSDGRAYMCVKRCPEGGIFAYLAVAPHELEVPAAAGRGDARAAVDPPEARPGGAN